MAEPPVTGPGGDGALLPEQAPPGFRCGFVALVGRPNVGKSTLLNALLGRKLSITSPKPQTTRHRIRGVDTGPGHQAIYVDTPGWHRPRGRGLGRALNRAMVRAAQAALGDVDLILLVVEALRWTELDEGILVLAREARGPEGRPVPLVAAVNKVDRVPDKRRLLPYLDELSRRAPFEAIVPVSATRGTHLDRLKEEVRRLLPEGPPLFPPGQLTDRDPGFLAAELVREQLMRRLGEELPYRVAVEAESLREEEGREGPLLRVRAVIWVERESHKPIVIGKGGAVLKEVGQRARLEMERLFGRRVHLGLWVRVREGWSDDERLVRRLGIED